MTVKELINQLQQVDQDLHVFVEGYEGGLSYPNIVPTDVALDVHDVDETWYYGKHEKISTGIHNQDSTIVKAIVLSRD